MDGTSYKIYLTKTYDVAMLIATGLRETQPGVAGSETITISCSRVDGTDFIPAIYHGKGLFYAAIKYRNGENFDRPVYEVILC